MKKSFRCFLASLLAPLLLLSGCARAEYLPLFPLVRPAFAGEQEMIFHIGGDEYRKLQVALFSGEENLLREAATRQDQLLLDLTRPLRPGECLTLFAGGQTAEGEEFSWQRDYHVSSLGAGCWQAEALLSRLRKLGVTAAARPARFPRSLTSLGDLSLFDFAAPEVLRSESPDGAGSIRIQNDAGDWDIVYLQEPGLSLSSMLWDAEREAYTAVSESFDFQAAHELSVSQQLPLDGKPTLEFLYSPSSLRIREIRLLIPPDSSLSSYPFEIEIIHGADGMQYSFATGSPSGLPIRLDYDARGRLTYVRSIRNFHVEGEDVPEIRGIDFF